MRWLLAFLLAQAAAPRGGIYTLPPLTATTLGGVKGTGSALVCSGTDKATGFNASGVLQCAADQTGSASPGGASGNIQTNNGTGGFGAYAGASCAYAVQALDASGGATCRAAPTIPTDLSAEPFITKVASANLSNEFALGSLATGLLKNTTTTGVPTIAAAGTDYGPPTSGNATGLVLSTTTTGAHTTYGGATCAYAVKQLDASGAPTCTSAPSIPTDVSGASYWTKVAETGLSNEVALGSLASGLILNATTTGVPTIYGGGSCAYAVKSLDASGAPTCTAAPTIPTDISGAHYVTTQAEAGLSAEAVLPTCTGTDKLTFNGTTISCATDQTSAGGGAPSTATYITQTHDATLSAEQALADLATGIVKNTTTTGVLSIATAGTDYAPGTGANGTGLVLSTTSTGALSAYGGTSCTNQFPRSLNASGAATCASIAGADLPNPSASTLGGVQSLAVVASKWINTISTSGVPAATQPAITDISGDPVKTFVTGDVNITSATASIITGLTLTVAAATSYGFMCNIVETNTSTSAMRYAVSTPASPTTVMAMVTHHTTALTTVVTEGLTAAWATTCTNCTAAVTSSVSATTHLTEINGVVLNGANTGSIQIFAAASTAAQANVVKKGSFCQWWTP